MVHIKGHDSAGRGLSMGHLMTPRVTWVLSTILMWMGFCWSFSGVTAIGALPNAKSSAAANSISLQTCFNNYVLTPEGQCLEEVNEAPRPACPEAHYVEDAGCRVQVPVLRRCEDGAVMNGAGDCVETLFTDLKYYCPSGYSDDGSQCVSRTAGKIVEFCLQDERRDQQQCVKTHRVPAQITVSCPSTATLEEGRCWRVVDTFDCTGDFQCEHRACTEKSCDAGNASSLGKVMTAVQGEGHINKNTMDGALLAHTARAPGFGSDFVSSGGIGGGRRRGARRVPGDVGEAAWSSAPPSSSGGQSASPVKAQGTSIEKAEATESVDHLEGLLSTQTDGSLSIRAGQEAKETLAFPALTQSPFDGLFFSDEALGMETAVPRQLSGDKNNPGLGLVPVSAPRPFKVAIVSQICQKKLEVPTVITRSCPSGYIEDPAGCYYEEFSPLRLQCEETGGPPESCPPKVHRTAKVARCSGTGQFDAIKNQCVETRQVKGKDTCPPSFMLKNGNCEGYVEPPLECAPDLTLINGHCIGKRIHSAIVVAVEPPIVNRRDAVERGTRDPASNDGPRVSQSSLSGNPLRPPREGLVDGRNDGRPEAAAPPGGAAVSPTTRRNSRREEVNKQRLP